MMNRHNLDEVLIGMVAEDLDHAVSLILVGIFAR